MKSAFSHAQPLSAKSWMFAFAGALALLGLGARVANANDLANPNLDLTAVGPQANPTPTSWGIEAIRALSGDHPDGCSSETWCNVQDPGGYGLFLKPFQGSVGDEISVHVYQDLPAAPGTKYTLSVYAAAEANFCAFSKTNAPAPEVLLVLEFLDSGSNVVATNSIDLVAAGLPNSGAGSMTQFAMPQVTSPAKTATVRAGVFMNNAYSTTGAQSFFVDAFDLESEAPAGAPVITTQPVPITMSAGDTGTFTVAVSVTAGASYQWQLNGVDLSNGGNISGATTATLTISNVAGSDAGRYRVRITNSAGSTVSAEVPLTMMGISFFPVISLSGKIGDSYRVDYAEKIAPAAWIPLSTNKLTMSPQMVIDTSSPMSNTRYYRSVFLP